MIEDWVMYGETPEDIEFAINCSKVSLIARIDDRTINVVIDGCAHNITSCTSNKSNVLMKEIIDKIKEQ